MLQASSVCERTNRVPLEFHSEIDPLPRVSSTFQRYSSLPSTKVGFEYLHRSTPTAAPSSNTTPVLGEAGIQGAKVPRNMVLPSLNSIPNPWKHVITIVGAPSLVGRMTPDQTTSRPGSSLLTKVPRVCSLSPSRWSANGAGVQTFGGCVMSGQARVKLKPTLETGSAP
jgi:hypothetical protein